MAKETENLDLDSELVRSGVARPFEDPTVAQYYVATMERIDDRRVDVVGMLMITYEWMEFGLSRVRDAAAVTTNPASDVHGEQRTKPGTMYWVQSVYTVPDARCKGVFKSLYAHIKAQVQADPGALGIRLYVVTTNQRAITAYERLGMHPSDIAMFKVMKGRY